MNHKLFTTLSGLSVTSALLVVCMMSPDQAKRLPAELDNSALIQNIETGAVRAAEEVAVPGERKQRRPRASLSMPYFSFAQSLRPRG